MVELRARYLHREGRGAGVEAVEHVEGGEGAAVEVVAADQMTGARCACAGRVRGKHANWSVSAHDG